MYLPQVEEIYSKSSTAPARISRSWDGRTSTLILKRGGRLSEPGYHFNAKQVSSEFAAFAAYRAMGVPVPSCALYDCVVTVDDDDGRPTGKCWATILVTEFIRSDRPVELEDRSQKRSISERG